MSNKIQRHLTPPIGELIWDNRPGATYEMHLDVSPDHHRKGIGRSMFIELEAKVKLMNGMCIYSFCAADNEKARGFFNGMGFAETLVKDFYGIGRDAFLLWKPIGRPE